MILFSHRHFTGSRLNMGISHLPRAARSSEAADQDAAQGVRLCRVSAEPDVGLQPTKLWDPDLSRNQESDT